MNKIFITLISISLLVLNLSNAKASKTKQESTVLNDSWYTMQAGSSPWGYYHEVIEKKEGKYFYRYEMVKRDNNFIYQENMGAVSQEDLTPIAFNLTKAGEGATEIINGTYKKEKGTSPAMIVDIKGNRANSLKRFLPENTILEVFFPIYISKNWDKIKPGQTSTVRVFAEDGGNHEFISKMAKYKMKEQNKKLGCTYFLIEFNEIKSEWCLNEKGSLVTMSIEKPNISVTKVNSEATAKAFLDEKTKSDN